VRKFIESFKRFFKRMPMYPALRDGKILLGWILAGRPVPPPHLVKQRAIRRYARKFHLPILVETGTYRGEMVEAMRGEFDRIYSVELGRELYELARGRFAGDPRITILQGDSGEVLRDLLPKIDRPALFWLDSHFSGGETARSALITPVVRELETILAHPLARRNVILIDDARLFNGRDDYPTIDAVDAVLARAGFGPCAVKDDIIRIHPQRFFPRGRKQGGG
jgi:23S rRNA A2030 N6-methylase RlmJ